MKALILLPAAVALGGCAFFSGADRAAPPVSGASGATAIMMSSPGEAMVVGGEDARYGRADYATYVEHQIDPDTQDIIATNHYVMVEDRPMYCPQADCNSTVAQYYEGETRDVVTRTPDSFIVR